MLKLLERYIDDGIGVWDNQKQPLSESKKQFAEFKKAINL